MPPESMQLPPQQIVDTAFISYDSITVITKILASMKSYGCTIVDKKYKQDQYSQKESKLKIKSFFEPDREDEEMSTFDNYPDEKTY